MNKQLLLFFLMSFVVACQGDVISETESEEVMHDYYVYHEDKDLSNLSFQTGAFEDGRKKLVQISLYHETEGLTVWRSLIEKKLVVHNDFTENDLAITKFVGPPLGLLEVFEIENDLGDRAYFKQNIDVPLDFDNYIGTCSSFKNKNNGAINCYTGIKLNGLRGELTYDKSELHRFDEFRKKTEEIVADYLPKHKEKYSKR